MLHAFFFCSELCGNLFSRSITKYPLKNIFYSKGKNKFTQFEIEVFNLPGRCYCVPWKMQRLSIHEQQAIIWHSNKLLTKWKDIVNNGNGKSMTDTSSNMTRINKAKMENILSHWRLNENGMLCNKGIHSFKHLLRMKHVFQFSIRDSFFFILLFHFKYVAHI